MYESVPLPSTWAERSYNNRQYHLVDMDKYSTEYIGVENHFDNYTILTIERVQNPYQYGKYLLYKLQRASPTEMIYFMPLKDSAQLDVALQFNCDYRRLNYDSDPFFTTVSAAIAYAATYNKIIVLQGLKNYTNHDSGRYPNYVVTYQQNN